MLTYLDNLVFTAVRPCYACLSVLDPFARTETGTWGEDPDGNAWTGTGTAIYAVDGSRASMNTESSGSGHQSLDIPETNWATVSVDVEASVEWNGYVSLAVRHDYEIGVAMDLPDVYVFLDAAGASYSELVTVDTTQPFRLEMAVDGEDILGRAYNLSESPPAWQLIGEVLDDTATSEAVIDHLNPGTAEDLILLFDNVMIDCGLGSGGGDPIPTQGRTCTNFTGGGDTFQLPLPVRVGTVEVYLDGYLFSPANYTATTPGLVVFDTPVDEDVVVRICYEIWEFNV